MNKIFAALTVCCLASLSVIFADPHRSEKRAYSVGMNHVEFIDTKRHGRPMVADVYYPAARRNAGNRYVVPFSTGFEVYKDAPIAFDGTKYPLILLSHGRSGNRFNLAWIAAYLASHGYIVASIDHYFATSYYLSFEYVASRIWERP